MITKCPRCGEHSYETLKAHSYCAECGFSPDLSLESVEDAAWFAGLARIAREIPDIDLCAPCLPLELTLEPQHGGLQ